MLDKVFLQVINMSYIGSIVILFILVARLFLKKAPKKYTYLLWIVALVRLVVPITFESIWSLIPVNPRPISNDILYQTIPKINTGMSSIDQILSGYLPPAAVEASINPIQVWVYIGSLIWIAGIATLLIYGIISLIKMKRKLEGASCYKDNIYITDIVDTAFVLGLFQPKIYLSASLSDPEKEYIVLHEQTHIKRFDHLARFISYLVLCIHWFNPLVWIAFWISGEDMEMSCDESVISELGHNVKKDYSQSLLNFATGRRNLGMTPLAFGEGETRGRIKNIVKYKKPKFYMILIVLLILLVVFVGLMTNPKKDSKYYAKQFLEIYTNPEDTEFAKYYHDFIDKGPAFSHNDYADLIKKEYGDLMTDKAFINAISNRVIPWGDFIRLDTNYTAKVDSIDLKEMKLYDDGRVYYGYLISLRVFSPDRDAVAMTVDGDIVMIEDNGHWKVDAFNAHSSSHRDLSNLLLPKPKEQEPIIETEDSVTYGLFHFINGEVQYAMSPLSGDNEQLAESIIMNYMFKSSAWPGIDIKALEEYYLIHATYIDDTTSDYYVFLHDGRSALQHGEEGMYSFIDEKLYEKLVALVNNHMVETRGQVLPGFTEEEVAAAREVVEEYFRSIKEKDRGAILKTLTPWHDHPSVKLYSDEMSTLISIDYNEDDPFRKSYIENGRGSINSTNIEDVIVFRVDFNVKLKEGAFSPFDSGDYSDWSMILIRNDKESPWLIDDQGY